MSSCMQMEKVWLDKHKYEEAERNFYEGKSGVPSQKSSKEPKSGKKGKQETIEESKCEASKRDRKGESQSSIVSEIVRCREQILLSLNGLEAGDNRNDLICSRLEKVETENKNLKNLVSELQSTVSKLESRVASLESHKSKESAKTEEKSSDSKQNGANKAAKEEDDDLDLFGSDEDEAANELREQRLKAYAEKKSKKPELIAKSSVILEVKPWDDETDMTELEKCVRSIIMDGLVWGVSKLVPVAFNIKKLQIVCVVEDDKVSIEELTEKIEGFEDYVQSVDIAAFQKI